MVLDFGKQHYKMDAADLQALSDAARNGDISAVMRAYEHELKVQKSHRFPGECLIPRQIPEC